ncbi:cobaltochelatase subunit CobN [Singulisphaera sp. PoT]|uniref:cobaltochelatase subunit CobN n=1 Tax=Singulisphaera sp. PoT TaxID=3411797 RepID=UPI003BF53016
MSQPISRRRVLRNDGKSIHIAPKRGHLLVCARGCCCGRDDKGKPAVSIDFYKQEYKRRGIRDRVQLTMSGCLGPCPLLNVALVLFDGRRVWFQSINHESQILAIYDYLDRMLAADRYLPPTSELAELAFDYYAWPEEAMLSGDTEGREGEGVFIDPGSKPADEILLLSHADTDLLTLQKAMADSPVGLPRARTASLNRVKSDEHLAALVDDGGRVARVVVARVHGGPDDLPGWRRLAQFARLTDLRLLLINAVGPTVPEFLAGSTVPAAVIERAAAYLTAGGTANIENLIRFLADELLRADLGSSPPGSPPRHGIYHPDLPREATLAEWVGRRDSSRPTVGVLFYRAHWLSGNLEFVDDLIDAIQAAGANTLPVFTDSLKEPSSEPGRPSSAWPAAFDLFYRGGERLIDVLVTTMSFAMAEARVWSRGGSVAALESLDVPILQAIASGSPRRQWEASPRGLGPLDTAMNVAVPELDGRIITVPISFKESAGQGAEDAPRYVAEPDRVARVAGLAARFAALARIPNERKRIAVILTNAPGKAARIGNAVGLDAPASLIRLFAAMREAGYRIEGVPPDGDSLIHELIDRCSYDETVLTTEQLARAAGRVPVGRYAEWFDELPEALRRGMVEQWGPPPGEAYVQDGAISLAGLELGNVFLALQPPRGYGMDPAAIYHQPDLPPPHNYYALYRWLRDDWGADAIVHFGKHGTLEWLPGKGVGLSGSCAPDAFLADLPLFYPFILNDPGEGAQAKRRGHAVLVDHLVPPLTSAGVYGELEQLAQLVDEYYQVELLDPSKLPVLQRQIWDLIKKARLDSDLARLMTQDHGDHKHEWDEGLTAEGTPVSLASMQGREVAHLLEDLDAYLCELAGAQIRDGLHTFGLAPEGEQLADLLQALTRLPNLDAPSLRAAACSPFGLDPDDLQEGLGKRFDEVGEGQARLAERVGRPIVTRGDALEAVDELAGWYLRALQRRGFVAEDVGEAIGEIFGDNRGPDDALARVGAFVCRDLVPKLARTEEETTNLLAALEGRYVPPGPSGAPTRGMAHVLPTGRNFYAVDPRCLPSPSSWEVGQALAREVVERHRVATGEMPERVGISVWGTSAIRTQGDDVAEVLALLGVRPTWHRENRRVLGFEVIPLEELGRPRVDVVIRISGFFRDAFPHLIALLDEAVECVATLDEDPESNFVRKHYLADLAAGLDDGGCEAEAERKARYRVFGAKPGSYGAGILPLIDEKNWSEPGDFAEAYVNWGGYAYTAGEQGVDARDAFRHQLAGVQVALHNQDNREHDIFDSDDYFQFHGGMIATIRALSGRLPRQEFGDSQDPQRPKVRDLKDEALRVFRTRVVNPKWLDAIRRHGYKGGLELNATVDYLFGYDATTGVVEDWMYDRVAQAYALDPTTRSFLERSNPWALQAIGERLIEAAERSLWAEPDAATLDALKKTILETEAALEARAEPPASRPNGRS